MCDDDHRSISVGRRKKLNRIAKWPQTKPSSLRFNGICVNQLNDSSNLGASYEGIPTSASSKSVILPYVVRGDAGCFYSNFTVQNLDSSDASIIINYFYSSGAPAVTSYDKVISHRIYNLYSATPSGQNFPTAPFAGSVVINSFQPIAVTTNLLNYCGGDDAVSYTGVPR